MESPLIVYSTDDMGYKLVALDFTTMKSYTSMPLPFIRYGLALVSDRALLVGGISFQSKSSVQSLIIWNATKGTCEEGPPMFAPRHSPFVLNYLNQIVFVIGGYTITGDDSVVPQRVCEALNLANMKWYQIPPFPTGPVLASFIFNGNICAFTESTVNYLDIKNTEEGWRGVEVPGQLLSVPMPLACQISNKEVLLFGAGGVEYIYNMENLWGEGRLSAVRANPQNMVVRLAKQNGLVVFDAFQNLWLFQCSCKKWRMIDITSLRDEADLLDGLDKLTISQTLLAARETPSGFDNNYY